jgi:hypothetical protein
MVTVPLDDPRRWAMKSSKLVAPFAMSVVLLLAMVAPASAGTVTQGTVYGQATMQPVVSIQLSGTGSDPGNPLVYDGRAGQDVWPAGMARVTLTNDGQVDVPILLGYGSDPTDGVDTWNLADSAGATDCKWEFQAGSWVTVPGHSDAPRQLVEKLNAGDSLDVWNCFTFPTTFNGNPHAMSALVIAGS